MNPKLTIIIPFLNEGEEVARTVKSIREHSNQEEIIILLINDASTDGFNYSQIAQRYNTQYIENTQRMGVAGSREIGIEHSWTPYFMLLDAHMRFYDNRWTNRIIEELEKDPKNLLCCQTKALNSINGEIVEITKRAISYGAHINFYTGRRLFECFWNFDKRQESPTMKIPCVLGATYCCSKEYWQYLKGLKGLMVYGNDEAYISIKVYLNGGNCKLLTDIAVGHIYRKCAPYIVEDDMRIYNKFFLSEILLPNSYKSRFFSQTIHYYKQFNEKYKNALYLFYEKRKEIYSLKEYYSTIFTHKFSDFEYLNRQNSVFQPIKENKDEMLKEIAIHLTLQVNQLKDNGLMSGKMGVLLYLYYYSRYAKNETFEWFADSILNNILDNLSINTPLEFYNGLTGIGWAIEYLYQNHFIYGDTNEILADIDQKVLEYDFTQIKDLNLEKGLGGIVHYVIARLYTIQKEKKSNPFDYNFLSRLYKATKQLLEYKEKDSDSILIFIRFVSWFEQIDSINPPSIYDIVFLIIPNEYQVSKYVISLEGSAGVGLKLLFENLKTIEPTLINYK